MQPGLEVKVLTSWDLGDAVGTSLPPRDPGVVPLLMKVADYALQDAVVDVTHRYKSLFYD